MVGGTVRLLAKFLLFYLFFCFIYLLFFAAKIINFCSIHFIYTDADASTFETCIFEAGGMFAIRA